MSTPSHLLLMKYRDPISLKEAFLKMRSRYSDFDEGFLQLVAAEKWFEILGEESRRYVSDIRLKDGVFSVRFASDAYRSELSMRKSEIIVRLNVALKGEYIKALRFL